MQKETSKRAGVNSKDRSPKAQRTSRAYKSRALIEAGFLPGSPPNLDQIIEDLGVTCQPNSFELWGFLSRKHTRAGKVINEGLVSCKLVTTAFAAYLVDSLQDSTTFPMDAFSWHAVGTDNTAEDNTDTALGVEIESRVDGTQIEGATANIYKSVATVTFTGTHAVAEHGLLSDDGTPAGTLMDRSVFSPVDNVINLDEIEYTYQLTVTAET